MNRSDSWLYTDSPRWYARLEALSQIGQLQQKIMRRKLPGFLVQLGLLCTIPAAFLGGCIAVPVGRIRAGMERRSGKGLAIVAIAKNEAESILEWALFHQIAGVDRIILYDNESTDGMKERLQPLIDSGFVQYRTISGQRQQHNAYNDALRRDGDQYEFIAFIDCDEYLMPVQEGADIKEILRNCMKADPNIGGIAVNWCMYGSSGYLTAPQGLTTECFLYRAVTEGGQGNDCVKTIVRPSRVKKYNHSHYPRYKFGFYSAACDGHPVKDAYHPVKEYTLLRINHYFTKSLEQWKARRALGKADDEGKRSLEEFYQHDRQQIRDEIGARYTDEIKHSMAELKQESIHHSGRNRQE